MNVKTPQTTTEQHDDGLRKRRPVVGAAVPEETHLVAQLRAGDEASYEHLVRVYAARMLAVARRFVGNEEAARDCVQEAFLQAFRSIDRFEERASLGTWLHRIVVNAALTKLRARERRPEESLEALLPQFDGHGCRIEPEAGWSVSVETLLEERERRAAVRRTIEQLPDGYRNVLMLRDVEGYTTEETAALLGLAPGAVKTRLHRARAALKTLLEPMMGGEDL